MPARNELLALPPLHRQLAERESGARSVAQAVPSEGIGRMGEA